LIDCNTLTVSTHHIPSFSNTMYEPTYLLIFFTTLFTTMSVVFALAGFGAFMAPNREAWEKSLSLCLGLFFCIGFARLAIESADRM
jgi:hypothetical protein